MVEKRIMLPHNVIEFARYQQDRAVGQVQAFSARICRHCGAAMADGENEDECSSAFNLSTFTLDTMRLRSAQRKFYAE